MTATEILHLIQHDADSFYLDAGIALDAYVAILAELDDHLTADDMVTLIAIGSVLARQAAARREVSPSPEGASRDRYSLADEGGIQKAVERLV